MQTRSSELVSTATNTEATEEGLSTGTVIGVAVGAALLLILGLVAGLFAFRHFKRRRRTPTGHGADVVRRHCLIFK